MYYKETQKENLRFKIWNDTLLGYVYITFIMLEDAIALKAYFGLTKEMINEMQEKERKIKCACGKGYASDYDCVCRFCREKKVRRALARKVGVKHRGNGMSITQYRVAIGECKRRDVYI